MFTTINAKQIQKKIFTSDPIHVSK